MPGKSNTCTVLIFIVVCGGVGLMLRSRKQRTVETVITRQMAFVQPTTVDGSAVAKGTLQGISGYDEKYPQVAKVSSNRGNKTHAFLELPIDPLSTWRETSFIPLYPKSSRAERVRKALPDLFELIPEQGYMSTLKNPCFMGYGRGKDGKGSKDVTKSLLCLPYFYIIGHVKGGTSDTWAFISKHPDINTGGVLKEQHYYSRPWINAAQYASRYTRFAVAIGGGTKTDLIRVAGDATPDLIWANLRYLNNPFKAVDVSIAEVLAEVHPGAKLILCLRDPISRLWSDFFYFAHRPNNERDIAIPHPDTEVTAEHFHTFAMSAVEQFRVCRFGNTGNDFDSTYKPTKHDNATLSRCAHELRTHKKYHGARVRFAMGCYGPFVQEYLAHFSREQLLVLTLEQYKANPRKALSTVFKHLEVRDLSESEWDKLLIRRKVTNAQGEHYKRLKMLNKTKEMLREAYSDCNLNLATLLNDPAYEAWNRGEPALPRL